MNIKNMIGMIMIALGVILYVIFQYEIIPLAYIKHANGNYGELYGPVSFIKIPIYIFVSMLILSGLFLFMYRKGAYTSESAQGDGDQGVVEGDVRKTGPMGQK